MYFACNKDLLNLTYWQAVNHFQCTQVSFEVRVIDNLYTPINKTFRFEKNNFSNPVVTVCFLANSITFIFFTKDFFLLKQK